MSYDVFSRNCFLRGCFVEADIWEDVLLRTDKWCFLEFERTCDVWKGYKYNPTDRTLLWHWFALSSLLI